MSVGLPVSNGEIFLRQAIESVLVQSFRDFELINSDNASTDATESICLEYQQRDRRVHYVRQAQNIGAAANFRFARDISRAQLFIWIASDDYWPVDYLGKLVNFITPTDVGVL